ncbi:MAG: hypothetical protein Q8N76_03260, partial [Candidatus Omnitrophota bacterium]|nr:hypothetical protein [Candidatus Omnitrophota bacterium]
EIIKLIESASVPVLLSKDHTYKAASLIYDLAIKIRPQDKEKTLLAEKLVKKYVDIDKILEKIK